MAQRTLALNQEKSLSKLASADKRKRRLRAAVNLQKEETVKRQLEGG